MRNILRLRTLWLFGAVLLALSTLALGQGTYTQIDYPGATTTTSEGIDSAGDIVGTYLDAGGYWRGFLLSAGTYTTIDDSTSLDTYLFGINDAGSIVGTTHGNFGFVYSVQTQSFTELRYPGARYTVPVAINNAGTVAGYFEIGGKYEGFELVGSTYQGIRPPTSTTAYVFGITTLGELVGTAILNGSNDISFEFYQERYHQITIPDAPGAGVLGISPGGDVLVGGYSPSSGTTVGFVYQNKSLTTLQFPGSSHTTGMGVNSAGEVVGYFVDVSGVEHGFTWTPPADAGKK